MLTWCLNQMNLLYKSMMDQVLQLYIINIMAESLLLQHILLNLHQVRIINPTLVFIHGLPQALSNEIALYHQFSIFGQISTIRIQYIAKDFYSSFINFAYQLSAALTILILNKSKIFNRKLRVYYGSTKFCPYFLKGRNCELNICNYAHYFSPELTHEKQYSKMVDHQKIAKDILKSFGSCKHLIFQIIEAVNQQKIVLRIAEERIFELIADDDRIYTNPETSDGQVIPYHCQLEKLTEVNEEWKSIWIEVKNVKQFNHGQDLKTQSSLPLLKKKIQIFLEQSQKFLQKLIFQSYIF